MNRKNLLRILCTVMICMLAVGMTACGKKKATGKEIDTLSDAKIDLYESAAELEADAEVVVRVEKTNEQENVLKGMGADNYYGYTKSMVEVKEVRKDISDQSIKVGDKIPVYESQFSYLDNEGTKVTCHVNRYKMMEPGNEYILYLNYSKDDEWFYILSNLFGKVPVSEEEELVVPLSEVTFPQGQTYDEKEDSYEEDILRQIREESLKP